MRQRAELHARLGLATDFCRGSHNVTFGKSGKRNCAYAARIVPVPGLTVSASFRRAESAGPA
jgi:hypothetical protein